MNVKGKENKPEMPDVVADAELAKKSKAYSVGNGYFGATLRKTLLRQSRSSIDNT